MFQTIFYFIVAVIFGLLWTIQLYIFDKNDSNWVVLWSMLYEPLKYYSKMNIVGPAMTRMNPQRWFIAAMSVDIFFSTFLVSLFQFCNSPSTAMMMVVSHLCSCLWRVYSGWDRVEVWWNRDDGVVRGFMKRLKGTVFPEGAGMSYFRGVDTEAEAEVGDEAYPEPREAEVREQKKRCQASSLARLKHSRHPSSLKS